MVAKTDSGRAAGYSGAHPSLHSKAWPLGPPLWICCGSPLCTRGPQRARGAFLGCSCGRGWGSRAGSPRHPAPFLLQCKLEQQACLSNKQLTVRCQGPCPCPTEQAATSTADGKSGNGCASSSSGLQGGHSFAGWEGRRTA